MPDRNNPHGASRWDDDFTYRHSARCAFYEALYRLSPEVVDELLDRCVPLVSEGDMNAFRGVRPPFMQLVQATSSPIWTEVCNWVAAYNLGVPWIVFDAVYAVMTPPTVERWIALGSPSEEAHKYATAGERILLHQPIRDFYPESCQEVDDTGAFKLPFTRSYRFDHVFTWVPSRMTREEFKNEARSLLDSQLDWFCDVVESYGPATRRGSNVRPLEIKNTASG